MDNLPSLYIPNVSARTTKWDVAKVFKKLAWGEVTNIKVVFRNKYNQVFIDFKKWNMDDSDVADIRSKLLQGKTIKVVYDEPWFWKCSVNRYSKQLITDGDLLDRKRQNQINAKSMTDKN